MTMPLILGEIENKVEKIRQSTNKQTIPDILPLQSWSLFVGSEKDNVHQGR